MAHIHHLNRPCVIDFATQLQEYWAERPDLGRSLYCGIGYGCTIVVRSEAQEQAEESIREELWSHIHEPLRDWRKYADAAHKQIRELNAEHDSRPLTREFKRETLGTYAEWFVLNQVTGLNASEIAEGSKSDLSTISKGIAEIRGRTGIPSREISVTR